MSIRYLSAAFAVRVGNAGRKLVLLKLADNANDDGICWPSLAYIAQETELSRESVKRHIRELENAGFLRVERRRRDGVNLPSVYELSGLHHLVVSPSPEGWGLGDQGVGSHRPHPGHTDPGVGSPRPQGWGHDDPVNRNKEPSTNACSSIARTRARARVNAREDPPAPQGGGAAAAPQQKQQGKARRQRPSGIVVWTPDDHQEASKIEAQHTQLLIAEAVKTLESRGLEPVPGRVAKEIERLARARAAAAADVQRRAAAVQLPPDSAAAAKGQEFIAKIRARRREHEAVL